MYTQGDIHRSTRIKELCQEIALKEIFILPIFIQYIQCITIKEHGVRNKTKAK